MSVGVDIKYRNEIKYICTEQQLALLENRIQAICEKDPHVGENGIYAIRSVYFDDYENSCYWENENGVDPREKYRIRIYDGNASYIMLECKKKKSGLGYKDVCPLTYGQCQALLDGSFSGAMLEEGETDAGQGQMLKRFFLQYRMRPLMAKVIVEYERTPYVYQAGNVRITFDRNISGSGQVSGFLEPTLRLRPVMPPGQHILEVKYDELIPDYLYNAMQLEDIHRVAYSKYYICRKFCG